LDKTAGDGGMTPLDQVKEKQKLSKKALVLGYVLQALSPGTTSTISFANTRTPPPTI
jgi:hypothetical protein